MISRARTGLVTACVMALGSLAPAWAQTSTPEPTPAPAEGKQKTLWDEFKLFSYIEMGATFNLNGGSEGVPGATSNGWTNSLRFYDIDQGYTFNMAELSIKRDPDEAFPFGMGLVLTAGQDAQKNHSIGILRGDNDAFPFRNTPWFDLQEVYISARIPIGNGPVIKVGKFVSLLGYEVIVDGIRTTTVGGVTLFSTTATLQYSLWKGLYGRGEYRHDNASEPVYGCRPATGCVKTSQDTLSVSLFYKFF